MAVRGKSQEQTPEYGANIKTCTGVPLHIKMQLEQVAEYHRVSVSALLASYVYKGLRTETLQFAPGQVTPLKPNVNS